MRLLLTGAGGQLGAYLLRALRDTDVSVTALSRREDLVRFGFHLEPVDLAQGEQLDLAFRRANPTVVLHAAALARVAACYADPAAARAINLEATAHLARLCARAGARLVFVSTDLVFDGGRGCYTEEDKPGPLSVYGKTKAAAEEVVRATPGAAVARVGLLFGPTLIGRPSFFDEQIQALREGRPIRCFVDEWRTPLGLQSAARGLLLLACGGFQGVIHLAGPERLSRWEMACRTAPVLGLDPAPIVPTKQDEVIAPEPRPRDTSLDTSLWRRLFPAEPWPAFDNSLLEMLHGSTTPAGLPGG